MSAAPAAFPYPLIATDLDGTLLRSDGTVSARTRAALAAATAAGAMHVVVTGRAARWTRAVLDDLDYHGLAVCGQGAQVYDAGAHQLLTSVTLDRRTAAVAVQKIKAEAGSLAVGACLDGLDGEILAGPGYRPHQALSHAIPVDNLDALWAAPLTKLYLQCPGVTDDELTRIARRTAGDLVEVTLAGPTLVELLPLGLSKARGLSLAARRLGVSREQTIAFGDMPNDVPLLSWARHGVAMAGAHPELLAVADEVTSSNDEDGIAVVLERLLG
ncbi:HAD family hydrolase [Streptomyces odontomachi]|uniref:HAD family hydrolase n=1 Tax=Streptomyces odontomachi TaxID=2944940 RepID=UPI00210A83CC|nr:HAD family hydrolase [Streptomyces sp. ODS25]